jgi:hypothetical protein
VNTRSLRIAVKKVGVKANPYYFSHRRDLHRQIRVLLSALIPQQTEHELIRFGHRPGYLIPDDLVDIQYCFSPGVGNFTTFEESIYERHKIKSFLCDYSVERPSADFDFEFDKKFLGAYNDNVFITLNAWYDEYLNDDYRGDMVLAMDIEGGEYTSLLSTSEDLLRRFRIIIVEFHHLFKLIDYVYFPIIQSTFARILASHFVVHIHPNNNQGVIKVADMQIPDVMEFTFLRRDRARSISPATTFPHPLDLDADEERQTIVLPRCWYQGQ